MPLEDLAAAVVVLGMIGYAIFGGADFGGGIWTGLASGPRAAQQRDSISRAMGPIWETNHIWLILIVVALFTAFPAAFADLFTGLLIPLLIALGAIALRGGAFAFRHYAHETGTDLPGTGFVFFLASVAAPMTMGMSLGAVAGGHITIENGAVTSGLWEPWLRPFSIWCGFIAVATCSFLMACYMAARTTGELQDDFRSRALVAGIALGAFTVLALPFAYWDADQFWEQLQEPAPIALMAAATVAYLASLLVLWRRANIAAPPVAAVLVALLIAGWGVIQHPYLILPTERISDMAAGDTTLRAFLIALPSGAVIVIPSLLLLYLIFTEKTGGPGVKTEDYGY
jgi:cytochrome d ubiquinol oxidase subunit II